MDTPPGASRCRVFPDQRRLVDQLGGRFEGKIKTLTSLRQITAFMDSRKDSVSVSFDFILFVELWRLTGSVRS